MATQDAQPWSVCSLLALQLHLRSTHGTTHHHQHTPAALSSSKLQSPTSSLVSRAQQACSTPWWLLLAPSCSWVARRLRLRSCKLLLRDSGIPANFKIGAGDVLPVLCQLLQCVICLLLTVHCNLPRAERLCCHRVLPAVGQNARRVGATVGGGFDASRARSCKGKCVCRWWWWWWRWWLWLSLLLDTPAGSGTTPSAAQAYAQASCTHRRRFPLQQR
jgi:hypothetical protein